MLVLLGLHVGSPFLSANLCPDWNVDRHPVAVVSVKSTFAVGAGGILSPVAAPEIELADRYAGDPFASALAVARENVPYKQGGEWYVLDAIGRAPHEGATAGEVSVSLRTDAGERSRSIRYFGRRVWAGSFLLPAISGPEPLTDVPLNYHHAFGGRDPEAGPRDNPLYEANWVGTGYWCNARRAMGRELPPIECAPFITKPGSRPAPAGFGPLAPHWMPRSAERGTPGDSIAVEGGSPRPADAAPSFFNAAPLDQRLPHPFQGGEVLTLTSLLPGEPYGEPCRVVLPPFAPHVELRLGETTQMFPSVCDTLVVDAEARRLHLIARVAIPWRHTDPRHGWVIVRDATHAATRPRLELVK